MTYHFGACSLQTDERVLRCGNRVVPLPPKAVDTLVVLASHSSEVVSKADLMSALWGDACVDEANLTQNIHRLRRAFADNDPKVRIDTIPRRGYRLVVESPGAARSSRPRALIGGALVAAGAVALGVALLPRLRGSATVEVPPSYRTGLFYWSHAKNTADVRRSTVYFRRAIAEQPASALGYAGLADADISLALREQGSPQAALDVNAAFAAAKKAVAVDPDAAESHTALAQAHAQFGDAAVAEREFQRAVALDPDSMEAHLWYAELLLAENRMVEARRHLRAAIAQNPEWTEPADMLALLDYLQRRYSESVAYATQASAQDPRDAGSAIVLALAQSRLGRRTDAEVTLRRLARDPRTTLPAHALLSYLYTQDRNAPSARVELALATHASRGSAIADPSTLVSLAATLAAQHEGDAAWAWLSRIDISDRKVYAGDARLDGLRDDPRFKRWLQE